MFRSIHKIKCSITVFVHRLVRTLGYVVRLHTGEDIYGVRGHESKSSIHQDGSHHGFQLLLFIVHLLHCFESLFIYTVLVPLLQQLLNTIVYTYHSHCWTQAVNLRCQPSYFMFHSDLSKFCANSDKATKIFYLMRLHECSVISVMPNEHCLS